ncbi:hypothetical protein D3C86_1475020 [compost metagenome]
MVFQGSQGVDAGEDHQRPCQVKMHDAGNVCLIGKAAEHCRYFEQAEDRNADAVGGGDQVPGNHHGKQPDIQKPMTQLGSHTGQRAVVGRRRWWRADKTPDQAQQHKGEQYQADAFVQFRCVFAPRVVVIEADHP